MGDSIAKILFICVCFVVIPLIGNKELMEAGEKWRENRKAKKQEKMKQSVAQKPAGNQTIVREPAGKDDEDARLTELAELCKMGDMIAMTDMAYLFRERCTESLRGLFDTYELKPVKENEDLINAYLKEHSDEVRLAEAYMMWLVRAALYGNEEAALQIGRCPYYKQKSYIPYTMLSGEGDSFIKFWDSDSLWEMGLIDMERGCTDCSLSINRRGGYFDFCYVAEYEPPDEYGFGAEWDYENIYYNEFFCRIPANSKEDISRQLLVLDAERETYWKNPAHDAANRKYRRRLQ